jgi:hypothetical protein
MGAILKSWKENCNDTKRKLRRIQNENVNAVNTTNFSTMSLHEYSNFWTDASNKVTEITQRLQRIFRHEMDGLNLSGHDTTLTFHSYLVSQKEQK